MGPSVAVQPANIGWKKVGKEVGMRSKMALGFCWVVKKEVTLKGVCSCWVLMHKVMQIYILAQTSFVSDVPSVLPTERQGKVLYSKSA